jgi:hypothetical protein
MSVCKHGNSPLHCPFDACFYQRERDYEELERLRAALKRIADGDTGEGPAKIARVALSEDKARGKGEGT